MFCAAISRTNAARAAGRQRRVRHAVLNVVERLEDRTLFAYNLTYDGAVGFSDLLALAQNYGATVAVRPAISMLATTTPTLDGTKTKRRF